MLQGWNVCKSVCDYHRQHVTTIKDATWRRNKTSYAKSRANRRTWFTTERSSGLTAGWPGHSKTLPKEKIAATRLLGFMAMFKQWLSFHLHKEWKVRHPIATIVRDIEIQLRLLKTFVGCPPPKQFVHVLFSRKPPQNICLWRGLAAMWNGLNNKVKEALELNSLGSVTICGICGITYFSCYEPCLVTL